MFRTTCVACILKTHLNLPDSNSVNPAYEAPVTNILHTFHNPYIIIHNLSALPHYIWCCTQVILPEVEEDGELRPPIDHDRRQGYGETTGQRQNCAEVFRMN